MNFKLASQIEKLEPGNYLMFVDRQAIDVEELCKGGGTPDGVTVEIVPVDVPSGKVISDVLQFHKVGDIENASVLSDTKVFGAAAGE